MTTPKTPVRGAHALLNRPAPAAYLADWTAHAAAPKALEQRGGRTAVVFRLGAELLAFPASIVKEVVEPRPVHTLPHRRGTAVLGLINVRGELLVCVDLPQALGFEATAAGDAQSKARLVVLRRENLTLACPVHEVIGVHRFVDADVQNVPATVAKAASKYSQTVFAWNGKPVGLLDEHLVFLTLKRSLV